MSEFKQAISSSPVLRPVLDHWSEIALPNAWLVAGAVAQSYWNTELGRSPSHGIRDLDIVYFDAECLGLDAEQEEERRVRALLADLPVAADVKNEARVHLWYQARFGHEIAPYRSTEEAIATFPTTATAVGVRPGDGDLEIHAPFGLADLCDFVVRPNKAQITETIYQAKVSRWRALWPELDIRPWHDT